MQCSPEKEYRSKSCPLLWVLSSFVVVMSPQIASAIQQIDRITALCDSGFVLLDRNEFEKAHRVFSEAFRIDSDHPRILLGMGRAMLELPKGTGRALDYLRQAVAKTPESIDAHYYKALAHVRMSRTDILGRENSREALEELQKVVSFNPSHPNAYYLQGQVYRDSYQDYEKAINAFKLQVEVNPDHVEARIECLKAEIDAGAWAEAISTAEGTLSRDPTLWEIVPFLAAAYWKAERLDEARQAFERFFVIAPREERDLYFDLSYLLTPTERREFASLDEGGRNSYWINYWRSRDPDPKTMVNERLLEHFIRVAYARIEFGKEKWPWDARGDFYVRYGEPDIRMGPNNPYPIGLIDDWDFFIKYRDLHEMLGITRALYAPGWLEAQFESFSFRDTVEGSGTPEGWIYLDKGINLQFDNPVMSGNYLVGDGMSSILVEAMGRRLPVVSVEEDKIETFDPLESAVTFRGENNKTVLEYAIGLLPDDIGEFRSLTGEYAYIDARLELFTTDWNAIAGAGDTLQHAALRPQVQIRGNPMFVHGTRVEVDPGDYIFSVLIMDADTGKRSTSREKVTLPDYSGDQLMISDILPAVRISEVGLGQVGRFVRKNLEVIPLPGRNIGKDQPIFIYFEIYNLSKDVYGGTRYKIEYAVSESTSDDAPLLKIYQGLRDFIGAGRRRAVLSSEFEQTDIRRDIGSYLEIDMSALPHGVYDLIISITDQVSGQTTSNMLTFRTLPSIPN